MMWVVPLYDDNVVAQEALSSSNAWAVAPASPGSATELPNEFLTPRNAAQTLRGWKSTKLLASLGLCEEPPALTPRMAPHWKKKRRAAKVLPVDHLPEQISMMSTSSWAGSSCSWWSQPPKTSWGTPTTPRVDDLDSELLPPMVLAALGVRRAVTAASQAAQSTQSLPMMSKTCMSTLKAGRPIVPAADYVSAIKAKKESSGLPAVSSSLLADSLGSYLGSLSEKEGAEEPTSHQQSQPSIGFASGLLTAGQLSGSSLSLSPSSTEDSGQQVPLNCAQRAASNHSRALRALLRSTVNSSSVHKLPLGPAIDKETLLEGLPPPPGQKGPRWKKRPGRTWAEKTSLGKAGSGLDMSGFLTYR